MAPISVMPIVGSSVFELCIFSAKKIPEMVGYFDDVAAADKFITKNQTRDIYITPQSLNPSLIQRAHNVMVGANERTNDAAVIGYKFLLLDFDPRQKLKDGRIVKRPKGVSSTDEEHQLALSLAKHIIDDLRLKDENYLLIDSGNGAHTYISVEEGIQEAGIKNAILGIKQLYETEMVEVDDTVYNPARLMRAPGSINCKGAIKRPVVYLHSPEHLMPVKYDFVAGLKIEKVHEPHQKDGVDLAEKIATQLGYSNKKRGMYILNECPFCHSTDRGAVVGKVENGGYFFKCHHNRCTNKKWIDLKAQVGLETGRLDTVRKVLKEQGSAALEDPDVQAEISKLKAMGDLHKLEPVCKEVGIEFKALKAAAKRPYAIAQDFADGWIREYHIKTDTLTREIFFYQDGVYVPAEELIAGHIDERFRGMNTTAFIKNVLDYVKRHSLYEFKDQWLALDNGLINPQTMEIVGFSPDVVTRIKLDVTHDPDAECPAWLKFLGECKSNVTVLQEAAGYPLLPDYPYQKSVMLLGSGGQGKSVFLCVISRILGADNTSSAALQTLVDNRFASSDLYGKLANVAGDIPDMALSGTAIFKALTGDDKIRAEKKGQDAFDFWNRAKLIFSANILPVTKDKTVGYFRRWVLIDFLREMVQNPNPHLAAELLKEKSGIFNWMLEGAKRVNEHGFSYTTNAEEMAKKYIERSEPVVQYLEEACVEDFDNFIESKTLYAAYNKWAFVNHKKRMSTKEFIDAMRNQNTYSIEYRRKTTSDSYGDSRPVGFYGLNFKAAAREKKLPKGIEGRPEAWPVEA